MEQRKRRQNCTLEKKRMRKKLRKKNGTKKRRRNCTNKKKKTRKNFKPNKKTRKHRKEKHVRTTKRERKISNTKKKSKGRMSDASMRRKGRISVCFWLSGNRNRRVVICKSLCLLDDLAEHQKARLSESPFWLALLCMESV